MLACAAALFFLYFFRLDAMGLVSTDEPRYAAIGREMARTGDWITPRLWGTPWFEKPALLYWLTGVASLAGLGPDLAPRIPVALLSSAFVVGYFFALRQAWGWRPALFAAAVLASSAGWLAYSQIGVPDLPMAACFNGAILLALPWLRGGRRGTLPFAAALLGLAVLAKGLVPLVLLLPLFWFARNRLPHVFHPYVLAAFAIVALPWYVLCTLRNGMPFLQTFFLEHQLGRFTSAELAHSQPAWFYVPVLLGMLFPWTALIALVFRRQTYGQVHAPLFAALLCWGLLFFSVSTNKLPGYLIPLLPSLAALIGLGLHQVAFAGPWLLLPTLTLAWVPVASAMLPVALAEGITRAWPVEQLVKFQAALLMLPLMLSGAAGLLAERLGKRHWAVAGIFTLTLLSVIWIKIAALPQVDRLASARSAYRVAVAQQRPEGAICTETMPRAWHYGFNYYFGRALPECKPGAAGLRTPRLP